MDQDRKPSRTHNRRFVGLIALIGVPLLAAACGASGSQQSVTPQAPASTSAAPTTSLKIVVDDGAGKVSDWTLTCDPAGGSHPTPAAACAALAAHGKTALPPTPKGIMCTQIYGGAQTAKITGSWDGASVDSSLTRHNGCEVSRWRELTGLLPAVGTAGGVT